MIALQEQTPLNKLLSSIDSYKTPLKIEVFNVTDQIPVDLRGSSSTHIVDGCNHYTKTLGMEWNSTEDYFKLPAFLHSNLSQSTLVSDVAKKFDALGWFSPSIVLMKMLLQRQWELKLEWDDLVSGSMDAVDIRAEPPFM